MILKLPVKLNLDYLPFGIIHSAGRRLTIFNTKVLYQISSLKQINLNS